MRSRAIRIVGLAAALTGIIAGMSGCGVDTPPLRAWKVGPAYWWAYGGESVQMPDTVSVGQPFEVRVLTTIGGCDHKGPDVVRHLSEATIEIAPRDSFFTGTALCPADIRAATHRITLQFQNQGEAQVQVTAKLYTASSRDSLVTTEHRVVVK